MKRFIFALMAMTALATAQAEVSHVSINERQFKLGEHPSLKLNIVTSHSNLKKVQFSIRQANGEERLLSKPLTSFMVEATGVEDVVDKNAVLIVKEYRVNRWYQVKVLSLFNDKVNEAGRDKRDSTYQASAVKEVKQTEVASSGIKVSGADVIVSRLDDCQIEFDGKETLWRIANRQAKRWGISPYGAMLAIFERNPKAFNNQSINGLKSQATLECPSMVTLEKYADAKVAMRQFNAME
ncbi:FimV/HubP family polar landmark protein [Shewanella sp. 0m-4]